jgi:hypothetical protein
MACAPRLSATEDFGHQVIVSMASAMRWPPPMRKVTPVQSKDSDSFSRLMAGIPIQKHRPIREQLPPPLVRLEQQI